ncbi:MAG TPA: hypothetical protein VK978_02215 [Candidatus Saccharimonadales bacterium]|nr:hypothetical protein [Candidatus Saccharimonadales bacterium]
MSDSNYTDVLLEDMNSKFDVVLEAVMAMREDMQTLAKQHDLEQIKSDVRIIKAAVTDLSAQVQDHESRLSELKSA